MRNAEFGQKDNFLRCLMSIALKVWYAALPCRGALRLLQTAIFIFPLYISSGVAS